MHKPAFDPYIPTRGTKVPDRPEWFHEIKHDGYRLIVQRDGKTVRLWTRNGYDWSSRYPRIVEAALRHRPDCFVLDGEAVLLGVNGADFNGLHSRKHDDEVQLYVFDILMSASDDLRPLPLHRRQNHLAKMLLRRVDGIILNHFQQGEIGPDLFRHACLMGLEGIVSKAQGPAVSGWPIQALDQGEEPNVTGDEPARRYVLRNASPSAAGPVMQTVWIYVDTSKQVDDRDHLKVFANPDVADAWFTEHDPEGVAFEYDVLDDSWPTFQAENI